MVGSIFTFFNDLMNTCNHRKGVTMPEKAALQPIYTTIKSTFG
jgi:hypothetical protein